MKDLEIKPETGLQPGWESTSFSLEKAENYDPLAYVSYIPWGDGMFLKPGGSALTVWSQPSGN